RRCVRAGEVVRSRQGARRHRRHGSHDLLRADQVRPDGKERRQAHGPVPGAGRRLQSGGADALGGGQPDLAAEDATVASAPRQPPGWSAFAEMENLRLLFDAPILSLQLLLDGVLIGAIFALAAYGMALVWGVVGLINVSQGELVMLGGYAAWFLYRAGIHPLFAVPL